jgi:hypothetical protein
MTFRVVNKKAISSLNVASAKVKKVTPITVKTQKIIKEKIIKQPTTLTVNAKTLALPFWMTPKVARDVMMIQLPCQKLDNVWIPITRLEDYHGEAPALFSQALGLKLHVTHTADDYKWGEIIYPKGSDVKNEKGVKSMKVVKSARGVKVVMKAKKKK